MPKEFLKMLAEEQGPKSEVYIKYISSEGCAGLAYSDFQRQRIYKGEYEGSSPFFYSDSIKNAYFV